MGEAKKNIMSKTEAKLDELLEKVDVLLDYVAYQAAILEEMLQARQAESPELNIKMPQSPRFKKKEKE